MYQGIPVTGIMYQRIPVTLGLLGNPWVCGCPGVSDSWEKRQWGVGSGFGGARSRDPGFQMNWGYPTSPFPKFYFCGFQFIWGNPSFPTPRASQPALVVCTIGFMDHQTPESLAPTTEDQLPAFLLPAVVQTPSHPLAATQPPEVTPAEHRKAIKDLHLTQFDIAFPTVLDKLSSGQTLTRIMKEYHADLDAGMFVRWVKRDPERAKLYDEAMAYRTDLWADRMVEYSEGGNDGLEDVQRSKLKVDTLKFLIAADNRKKYGSAVQVDGDVQTTITINAPWMRSDRLSYADQVQDVTPRSVDE